MYRSVLLLIALFFIACHPKTLPSKLEPQSGVTLYKVYNIDSDEVVKAGIDFSNIPNLQRVPNSYMDGIIGIAHRREDLLEISKEIDKRADDNGTLRLLWSSKPLRYEYPDKTGYVLFAVQPNHQAALDTLNSHYINVSQFWSHETFEVGILIHYTDAGKQVLKALAKNPTYKNISLAYVVEGEVWEIRRLRPRYHESLAFYGFKKAEEAEELAKAINKKSKF